MNHLYAFASLGLHEAFDSSDLFYTLAKTFETPPLVSSVEDIPVSSSKILIWGCSQAILSSD